MILLIYTYTCYVYNIGVFTGYSNIQSAIIIWQFKNAITSAFALEDTNALFYLTFFRFIFN